MVARLHKRCHDYQSLTILFFKHRDVQNDNIEQRGGYNYILGNRMGFSDNIFYVANNDNHWWNGWGERKTWKAICGVTGEVHTSLLSANLLLQISL